MGVLFSISGHVATVTLDRPEALNSIDAEMRASLSRCWDAMRRDDAIRVVVLTGNGRAFCTGADLKNTMPPDESYARAAFLGEGDHSFVDALELEKPMICAINGFAIGGGLELALACDIRIASDNARFGLTEVRVGSIPGAGGTQRLPRIVGMTNAMHMLLTGELVDSAEALRIGLVSRVVTAESLAEVAANLAATIAANAPLAVRAVKSLAHRGADLHLEAGIEAERRAWGILRNSEDRIEGRLAFQQKRTPNYRGR